MPVFAIRVDHMWDDWACINNMLGDHLELSREPPALRSFGSLLQANDKSLSEGSLELLCSFLEHEYVAYRRLVRLAVNLDELSDPFLDRCRSAHECVDATGGLRI
mmetsp:Transcript_26596/g.83190  ORF Transcript_26596/g.83190 Transcript_26596/m.83190 type:complete len:105 (-) Transcript_26596:221-535(-)